MRTYAIHDNKQTECHFLRIKPKQPDVRYGPGGFSYWEQTVESRADAQLTFPHAVDFLTREQQIALVVDSQNYQAVVLRVVGRTVLCRAWRRAGLSIREAQRTYGADRK